MKLDEINAYQKVLISIANETKNEVNNLCHLVDENTQKLSMQLQNIEENSEMTRYYSKVSAECQTYKLLMDAWR